MKTSPRVPKGIVASDLLQRRVRQPKWIVSGLIKPGLILFAGAGKLGKTKLALEVAVAVATGTDALGAVEVDAGTVLFLALEDSKARLASRLGELCQGRPVPSDLKFFLDWPKLDDRGIDKLDRLILAQEPRTKLVVIDTIALARPVSTGSSYLRDYSFMRKLQKLALRRRVGVVAITHLTKNSHKDYASDVQGSVGGVSSCDTLLHLSRARGASHAVLQMTSRETGEKTIPLDFTEAGQWRLAPATEEAWMSPERKAILAAIRASAPREPKEIAEATGLPYGSCRVVMPRMARAGQLRRVRGGYALPEAANSVGAVNSVNGSADVPSLAVEDPAPSSPDQGADGGRGGAGRAQVVSLADFVRCRARTAERFAPPDGTAH